MIPFGVGEDVGDELGELAGSEVDGSKDMLGSADSGFFVGFLVGLWPSFPQSLLDGLRPPLPQPLLYGGRLGRCFGGRLNGGRGCLMDEGLGFGFDGLSWLSPLES